MPDEEYLKLIELFDKVPESFPIGDAYITLSYNRRGLNDIIEITQTVLDPRTNILISASLMNNDIKSEWVNTIIGQVVQSHFDNGVSLEKLSNVITFKLSDAPYFENEVWFKERVKLSEYKKFSFKRFPPPSPELPREAKQSSLFDLPKKTGEDHSMRLRSPS